MFRRSKGFSTHALRIPLILLSLILLGACGGDDEDDGSGDGVATSAAAISSVDATPDSDEDDADDDTDNAGANGDGPRSLLTEDEVAAAIGEEVLDAEALAVSDDTVLGNCMYNVAPEGSFKVVSIFIHGSAVDPVAFAPPADAQEVEGFGDAAHWDPSLSVLTVRYDEDDYFTVQVATASGDAAADLEVAKDLAAKIVERL